MSIKFGTDGWRAVISDTFTFTNVRRLAQAIADAVNSDLWLTEKYKDSNQDQFVIGYDTRFLSRAYAKEVARVLAANGITVHLAHADCPTPAISYAVTQLKAAGAVMVTASHNAPRYNGIKLKGPFGGSILPSQSKQVERFLEKNELNAKGPNLLDYERAIQMGLIVPFNPVPPYYSHLQQLIDFDVIGKYPRRMHVVADAMYGSGRGHIKGSLAGTGVEVHEIRSDLNPGFGGIHPEPIMKYLHATVGAVSSTGADIALITDGDADRTGAMDNQGHFVDPHKIMAVAVRYLVAEKGLSGSIVKTVSSTRMLNRQAAKYGLDIYETPVGFNYIADHMMSGDVLLGGEESGGISIKGHIPEGDGVLMGLLLLEILAHYQMPFNELIEDLLKEFGPMHYERRDMRLARAVNKKEMVARLSNEAPSAIGSMKVADVVTVDGVKYVMDNDSWLLIRPSGTEPVLRVYSEGLSASNVEELLGYGEQIAATV